MTDRPATPLLDTVGTPAELRRLKPAELRQLADELRAETISAVSVTGGHLGAGLGVVELTVALHYVFETPKEAGVDYTGFKLNWGAAFTQQMQGLSHETSAESRLVNGVEQNRLTGSTASPLTALEG